MNEKMMIKKIALRALYELRFCPPDEVLFSSSHEEELKAHLGYCQYCQERLTMSESEHNAWEQLASKMKSASQQPVGRKPQPGQVWSLSRDRLSDWGPYDRYYSPPLVLLLSVVKENKLFRVAQICSELELQEEGDVRLSEALGFAESWNIYTVHLDDLSTYCVEVDTDCVRQVQSVAKSPPLESKSLIARQFRDLEVQVGAFMAMQALPQVMAELEVPVVVTERVLAPGLVAWTDGVKTVGLKLIDEIDKGLEVLKDTFVPRPFFATRGSSPNTQASGPKLTTEDKRLIENTFPIVPIRLSFLGDKCIIVLKVMNPDMNPNPLIEVILSGKAVECNKEWGKEVQVQVPCGGETVHIEEIIKIEGGVRICLKGRDK